MHLHSILFFITILKKGDDEVENGPLCYEYDVHHTHKRRQHGAATQSKMQTKKKQENRNKKTTPLWKHIKRSV